MWILETCNTGTYAHTSKISRMININNKAHFVPLQKSFVKGVKDAASSALWDEAWNEEVTCMVRQLSGVTGSTEMHTHDTVGY